MRLNNEVILEKLRDIKKLSDEYENTYVLSLERYERINVYTELGYSRPEEAYFYKLNFEGEDIPHEHNPIMEYKNVKLQIDLENVERGSIKLIIVNKDFLRIFSFLMYEIEIILNKQIGRIDLVEIFDEINNWERAFEKVKNFNQNLLLGLLSELLFYEKLMIIGNMKNINDSWFGPARRAKDFDFENVSVEVKFTNNYPKVKISSLYQLEMYEGKKNFLLVYSTDEKMGEKISLVQLMERILENIQSEDEKNYFKKKIIDYGYDEDNEKHRELGIREYDIYLKNIFLIDHEFPKLIKSEISSAIDEVKYDLNLDGLSYFTEKINYVLKEIGK